MEVQYIDYGVGNKKSVINGLTKINHRVEIISDPNFLNPETPIILPGVGSYLFCKQELENTGFFERIKNLLSANKIAKLIGICVGHQLLFESGNEDGRTEGFGVFEGSVESMVDLNLNKETNVIIPNISWCDVIKKNDSYNIGKFYFIHSYANTNSRNQIAFYNWNGVKITSIARSGGVWGVQFHPEKSGEEGLNLLDKMITLDPLAVL